MICALFREEWTEYNNLQGKCHYYEKYWLSLSILVGLAHIFDLLIFIGIKVVLKQKKEGRIWGQAKAIKSFFSFFFLGDFLKQYALLGAAAKGEIKLYQPKVDVLD